MLLSIVVMILLILILFTVENLGMLLLHHPHLWYKHLKVTNQQHSMDQKYTARNSMHNLLQQMQEAAVTMQFMEGEQERTKQRAIMAVSSSSSSKGMPTQYYQCYHPIINHPPRLLLLPREDFLNVRHPILPIAVQLWLVLEAQEVLVVHHRQEGVP